MIPQDPAIRRRIARLQSSWSWRLLATMPVLFSATQLLHNAKAADQQSPNVVLIMADDLGVECLGSYGGTSYQTPALDKLAREGVRFTHAYAQPLCANTRLQLMTGLYNQRNWIAFGILDPESKTFGHWMQEAGYKTCIAGKWQLQSYDPPDYPDAEKRRGIGMKPEDAGFDEYALWHTGHTELKGSRYADPVILENGKFRDDLTGRYGPDIWVEYINGFMERNADSPFFVYYPMALPHWPMVPTPDSPEWQDPAQRNVEQVRFFKDMVEYTDKCVGRVVAKIDQLGIADNTLVIFYSDNGTHLKITSQTQDGPVAGGKGETTDAGTHVPLICRQPGTIKPGVNDNLVDSTDFLPTILDAAGHPLPANAVTDGLSFHPQLLGMDVAVRPWVFCHYDPRPGWDKDRFRLKRFARDKRYKLYDDGKLFDVPNDKLEQRPILANEDTAETKLAREKLAKVMKSMSNR